MRTKINSINLLRSIIRKKKKDIRQSKEVKPEPSKMKPMRTLAAKVY